MMAFNNLPDQDVVDERNAAPAVTRRKLVRKALRWRQALEAFDRQQMLNEFGIESWELGYD